VIDPEAEVVRSYLEKEWIREVICNGRRCRTKFPIDMWNYFEVSSANMAKTNNAIEGWHCGFEATVDHIHSNILKFVEAI